MAIKKDESHRAPPYTFAWSRGRFRFLSRCGVQVQVLRRPTRGTATANRTYNGRNFLRRARFFFAALCMLVKAARITFLSRFECVSLFL